MLQSRPTIWVLLVFVIGFLLFLLSGPKPAGARWPPFNFRMSPTHENGRITYNLTFNSRPEYGMINDVSINIPLPAGTRYVEGNAPSTTTVSFDGQEIKFFSSILPRRAIRNVSFVVEIQDSEQTVFTTHAWITWKGDLAGDYLTREVSIDLNRPPIDWDKPARSRLQVETIATSVDGVVTYFIYPTNKRGRMWDVEIKIPIPDGTSLLSVDAPLPFESSFEGQEVTFFAFELEQSVEIRPLQIKTSTSKTTPPVIVTHAWATWKNVGRSVTKRTPFQENVRAGDLIVQPGVAQWVAADPIGDVPLANYDITSIALEEEGGNTLKITFYTVGEMTESDDLKFVFKINSDCLENEEHQATYVLHQEQGNFQSKAANGHKWSRRQPIEAGSPGPRMVVMRIPYNLFANPDDATEFCGAGRVSNQTTAFSQVIGDVVPNAPDKILPKYTALTHAESTQIDNQANPTPIPPTPTPQPTPVPKISGKLAIPIDDGLGFYDTYVFSLPDGHEIAKIPKSRQPNFQFGGQRLLINRQGGGKENVYEHNLVDGSEMQVSDAPRDSHPFYDPWGNRVVYGNPELAVGLQGHKPFIFVQCSLTPPHLETELTCNDIAGHGMLVPAGLMGEIHGTHPVWASNDMIIYNGCNSWAGFGKCGIYSVPSVSTRGFSSGFIPHQLTNHSNDLPGDTKGNLIAFTSFQDGNWEAYMMNLNGNEHRNISNSPQSSDGLPTISPDGQWLAFVSDRGSQWAVWVTLVEGGKVEKLFNLPDNPWGSDEDRLWLNERISWGMPVFAPLATLTPVPTSNYILLYTPTPIATPITTPSTKIELTTTPTVIPNPTTRNTITLTATTPPTPTPPTATPSLTPFKPVKPTATSTSIPL